MNLNEATELLNSFQSQTDIKSEKKVYTYFTRVLASLKDKDLSEDQLRLIKDKLSSLNLKTATENRRKFYKKQLSVFTKFLKKEFYFTTEKYYTELGMVYGMSFGTGIGVSLGTAYDPAIGTSIGLSIGVSIGMIFGMMYGAKKDAEAKKLGRVI